MSIQPPTAAWQALQTLAEKGASFADFLKLLSPPKAAALPDELLRRAALVRAIDEKLYVKILARELSAPPFQEFTAHPFVESAGPLLWQLRDDERNNQQSRWWKSHPAELKQFSKALQSYYRRAGQEFDAFLHSLFAAPERAKARFLARYAELDGSFSLSGCEALLRALQQRQFILPADLAEARERRQRYLQSRTLFAEDFYRTAVYLDRRDAREKVTSFLAGHDVWLLQLLGGGGVGKTVFLRWLIARHCVLEQDGACLPVARIDLDFVDHRTLGEFPLLVFLPLLQQLIRQVPNDSLHTLLLTLSEFDALLRRPGAGEEEGYRAGLKERAGMNRSLLNDLPRRLASALGAQPVLVVLDTLEDMLLHHASGLEPVLQLLAALRAQCPGLKLILSGRFDLGDKGRLPQFLAPLAGQTDRLILGPFNRHETETYLRDLRHVERPGVIEEVWKKTKGHALELTLYGDLLASDPNLTAAEIRRYPDAQYARLIERIIDRIPAQQASLKWLLRYAVVPRRLDLDYIRQVINTPLTRESRGSVNDDTTRYPDGRTRARYGKQARWAPLEQQDLDQAWNELRSYAAQTSWVNEEQGVIRLQPEIVEPMRSLLRLNPIFQELQVASQRYFEKLAKEREEEWGQWMEEAVYHKFQQPAAGRADYWARQLRKARQRGYADLEHIAGIVFNSEFLDEKRKPRVHVSPTALARAAFDVAYATLIRILRSRTAHRQDRNSGQELARCWEDLKHFSRGAAVRAVSQEKKDLIHAAALHFSGEKKRSQAIALAESAAAALNDNQYRLAAHFLLARVIYWGDLDAAGPHFQASYRLARASRSRDLPPPLADFYLARILLEYDQLGPAAKHFARAWEQTRQGSDDCGLAPAALFRRLTEVYFEGGEWAQARKLQGATQASAGSQPWMEFQWLHAEARLRLRLGEFQPALEACTKALPLAPDVHARAVATELRAGLEAHRYRIEESELLLQQAEEWYRTSGSPGGVPTCRLKLASIYLDQCGNVTRAGDLAVLDADRSFPSAELFFESCRLQVRVLAQTDPADARAAWAKFFHDFQRLEYSPRMQARLLVLGLALDCAPRENLALLWPLLKKLSTASVYRTLEGFSLFSGIAWAQKFVPILRRAVPRPNPKSADFQLQALTLAEAFRFFGAHKEALRLLEALRKGKHSAWFGRLIRTSLYRLQPDAWTPDPAAVEAVAEEFADAPAVRMIMSLEEGTRAFARGFRHEAEYFLAAADGVPDLPALARSHWSVQYYLLSAQLHSELRERALLRARDIAGEIGYQMPAWVNEWLSSAAARTTLTEADLAPAGTLLSIVGGPDQMPAVEWTRQNRVLQRHQSGELKLLLDESASSGFLDWFLDRADHAARLAGMLGVTPDLVSTPPVGILTQTGLLSGMPWELAFPLDVITHRLPQGGPRLYDTVLALQRALLRRGHHVVADGILGPQTSARLTEASPTEPARMRREFLRSGNPSSPVLIVQREPEYSFATGLGAGHAAESVRAADFYEDHGVKAHALSLHDPKMLLEAMNAIQPGIIHFVAGFWQDRNGETFMDLAGSQGSPLSARSIASALLSVRGGPRPVLVVEALTPRDDYDFIRQGLCRNWFCADLMSAARPKAVFATGLAASGGLAGFLRDLIACLCRPSTLGELARNSPRPTGWPPALFTSDPGLPLWEDPPYGNDPR